LLIPLGTLTVSVTFSFPIPDPLQVGQGVLIVLPSPLHLLQDIWIVIGPIMHYVYYILLY